MQVPFANEVREARRLAEESSLAAEHLALVDAQLSLVGVFQQQLQRHGSEDVEVPGDEIIESLAEHWDMLRDLPSTMRHGTAEEALVARRSQLLLARQVLSPVAAQAEAHGHAVHELQHQQVDALREPRYADVMALLTEWSQERNEHTERYQAAEQKRIRMKPAFDLLGNAHREVLEAAQNVAEATEPLAAWLKARHALLLVDILLGVIVDLELDGYTTKVPSLPELPDGRGTAELLAPLHTLEETLGALRQRLATELARTTSIATEAKERHDELTRRILDLTG